MLSLLITVAGSPMAYAQTVATRPIVTSTMLNKSHNHRKMFRQIRKPSSLKVLPEHQMKENVEEQTDEGDVIVNAETFRSMARMNVSTTSSKIQKLRK